MWQDAPGAAGSLPSTAVTLERFQPEGSFSYHRLSPCTPSKAVSREEQCATGLESKSCICSLSPGLRDW